MFLEFKALSSVYNVVSPYNAEYIENNIFNRFFFPSLAGLSISKEIINNGKKVFLKDIPQIYLQLYFLYFNSSTNFSIYIGLTSTLANTLNALGEFLRTRPSIVTQMDFDKLSFRREKEIPAIKKNFYTGSANMWNQINLSARVYKKNNFYQLFNLIFNLFFFFSTSTENF
jgi:hypothetical protein